MTSCPTARRACAGTGAYAARSRVLPSGRASQCSARTSASTPSSSTISTAGRSRRHRWRSLPKSFKGTKTEQANEVGKQLAASAKKAGVESCVFDRAGYLYHGRVKALAEGAREGGLTF